VIASRATGWSVLDDHHGEETALRLLLINGNTSAFVTERAADEARLSASLGTEITGVTGETGARIIATRVENAIAEREMITLAARHGKDVDGVLIAVSFDTALPALRELMPVPVVGMTEAAMLTAYLTGGRIGLVSLGARVRPVYADLIRAHHLDQRIAGWQVIEAKEAYSPDDPGAVDSLVLEACHQLIDQDGCEVIVLLGAVMAGAPRRLQQTVPVPLIDGIAAATHQLELLVKMALPKPKTGSYAHHGVRALDNVDPSIDQLLHLSKSK
jgi:allantoin racemase